MSSIIDNPAARLQAILKRAQPLAQAEGPAATLWMKVFEVENTEGLMSMTFQFVTQIRLAREAITALPEDRENREHLLEYFPILDQLAGAMLGMVSQPTANYRTFLSEALIYSLGGCSDALRRNGKREPTFDEEGIAALIATIREIQDEVADSSLPGDLKLFIIQRLRDVEMAVRSYQVSGFDGIERALDTLVGVAWRQPVATQKSVENWFMRLIRGAQSFARGTAALASDTQRAIESIESIGGS